MRRIFLAVLIAASASGCAQVEAKPEIYTGEGSRVYIEVKCRPELRHFSLEQFVGEYPYMTNPETEKRWAYQLLWDKYRLYGFDDDRFSETECDFGLMYPRIKVQMNMRPLEHGACKGKILANVKIWLDDTMFYKGDFGHSCERDTAATRFEYSAEGIRLSGIKSFSADKICRYEEYFDSLEEFKKQRGKAPLRVWDIYRYCTAAKK